MRQDAIKVTGLSSNKLSRLDSYGLVQPVKFGSAAHPVVMYEPSQMVELELISLIGDRLKKSEIQSALEVLRSQSHNQRLLDGWIVIHEGNLAIWEDGQAIAQWVQAETKTQGVIEIKVVKIRGDRNDSI